MAHIQPYSCFTKLMYIMLKCLRVIAVNDALTGYKNNVNETYVANKYRKEVQSKASKKKHLQTKGPAEALIRSQIPNNTKLTVIFYKQQICRYLHIALRFEMQISAYSIKPHDVRYPHLALKVDM